MTKAQSDTSIQMLNPKLVSVSPIRQRFDASDRDQLESIKTSVLTEGFYNSEAVEVYKDGRRYRLTDDGAKRLTVMQGLNRKIPARIVAKPSAKMMVDRAIQKNHGVFDNNFGTLIVNLASLVTTFKSEIDPFKESTHSAADAENVRRSFFGIDPIPTGDDTETYRHRPDWKSGFRSVAEGENPFRLQKIARGVDKPSGLMEKARFWTTKEAAARLGESDRQVRRACFFAGLIWDGVITLSQIRNLHSRELQKVGAAFGRFDEDDLTSGRVDGGEVISDALDMMVDIEDDADDRSKDIARQMDLIIGESSVERERRTFNVEKAIEALIFEANLEGFEIDSKALTAIEKAWSAHRDSKVKQLAETG